MVQHFKQLNTDNHESNHLSIDEIRKLFAAMVGAKRIRYDSATIAQYARSTSETSTEPVAVFFPNSTEDVQLAVQIANQYRIALYPVSRGQNWGYGDTCAPSNGQMIVDFSHMNRIIEVNEQLAYAVIEPGVSQGQLYEYLQDKHPGLWMDSTGAGPNASLVGNTLDRGFGHTRYADHFQSACGMEVVLPDGRILKTGYGHYDGAKSTHVYRYGVGPFIDGLFVQSNMGIITRLGIWLMPKPEAFSAFFFSAKNDSELSEIVDCIAPIRRSGMLQSAIHIGNDIRVMSAKVQYPWELTKGGAPLPQDVRKQLRRKLGIGAWSGCGAIYGSKGLVRDTQSQLRKALGRYSVKFVNDRKLARAEYIGQQLERIGIEKISTVVETIKPIYGLLKGVPSKDALFGAAWRVREKVSNSLETPFDSNAGLIWVSPILPMTGQHAEEVMGIMNPIYHEFGFDPLVSFTMLNERAMVAVTNLAFDRSIPEEVEQAHQCYHELTNALMEQGYISYRTGPIGYPKLSKNSEVFWDVIAQMKKTLDPNNIVSPGRYVPHRRH